MLYLKKTKYREFFPTLFVKTTDFQLVFNFEQTRTVPGGGTWVFFGWVCAARNSKLAPRSKTNSPKIDTPF